MAISFATLAYSNAPASYLGLSIGLTLAGTAIIRTIIALFSSYPLSSGQVQDNPAAIIAVLVSTIVSATTDQSDQTQFLTVFALVAISTGLVGLTMILLGRLKLGRLVRFIPYPVIGGFLAGTGWLLLKGGIQSMTDLPISFSNLAAFFDSSTMIQWLPGIIFALLLVFVTRRIQHPLLIPAAILIAICLFYVILAIAQISIPEAQARGLLLGPFSSGSLLHIPVPIEPLQIEWNLIAAQAGHIAVLIVIVIISLLLNCSGIELAVGRNIDLNRELETTGVANLFAAFTGSLPGYHGLGATLLGHLMGAHSRLTGLVGTLLTILVLAAGAQLLSVFPKAVLGGVVAFLGLGLLVQWVIEGARKLTRADYLIVLLILAFIVFLGHLVGVVAGTVAAAVLFLVQYSRQSPIKYSLSGDVYRSTVIRNTRENALLQENGQQILILQLHNYIFFGTANTIVELIRNRVLAPDALPLRYVILDLRLVSDIDSSAALSFIRLHQLAHQFDFMLVYTQYSPALIQRIVLPDSADSTRNKVQLFSDLDRAMEWCEDRLLQTLNSAEPDTAPTLIQQMQIALGADTASLIFRYLERLQLPQGSYLVHQGDESTDLFFVESGILSVQIEIPGRTATRVRTARAGTVLGEVAFYQHTKRTASIVAEQPSSIYMLSQAAMQTMWEENPMAAAAIHKYLAEVIAGRLSENILLLRRVLV